MKIYTIGYTKKSLERFINLLKKNNIKKVIDIRLNNTSQLAGFAKKDDLKYILSLVGIEYQHIPELAPSEELLKSYQRKEKSWEDYEKEFLEMLNQKNLRDLLKINENEFMCLLCSEDKPEKCHRRIVAEQLQKHFGNLEIIHLI